MSFGAIVLLGQRAPPVVHPTNFFKRGEREYGREHVAERGPPRMPSSKPVDSQMERDGERASHSDACFVFVTRVSLNERRSSCRRADQFSQKRKAKANLQRCVCAFFARVSLNDCGALPVVQHTPLLYNWIEREKLRKQSLLVLHALV